MQCFDQICTVVPAAVETVLLPYELRQRSRVRIDRADGSSFGLVVPRGTALHAGLALADSRGSVVQVVAAPERLTAVTGLNPFNFARVCYHLGNRHTQLEIGEQTLWFLPDHVLEELCISWGGALSHVDRPFSPEVGAYAASSHVHD